MSMKKYLIYKIYWPGKAFYYGKTKGYRKRHNRHLREMKDGSHHNKNLISCYAKWGEPKFKIVAYAESDEELSVKERAFLNFYKDHKKCLNAQLW